MQHLIQVREINSYEGMFGSLYNSQGDKIAVSLELPWRGNARNMSCIPPGSYLCTYNYSPAFKRNMYLVQNVPNRSGIRIHKGSYAGATDYGFKSNFLGCISWGRARMYSPADRQHIVHTTAVTIANIERDLEYKDFLLIIVNTFPEIT